MDKIVVFAIIAVAVFYLGRRFYRSFGGASQTGCGCGCSGCDLQQSCDGTSSEAEKKTGLTAK